MKTKRPGWTAIAAQLARRGSPVPRIGADRFWEAFQAACHLYPQRPSPSRVPARRTPWLWTLGSLGATSMLAVGAWVLFLQPAPVQATSAIHSYEIDPQHGTVMILQDETSHAAILWVANIEMTDPANEGEPRP